MARISAELQTVKQNYFKYLFPLLLFISIYPSFIFYDVHILFRIAFIAGLAFFSISYDKLEKELNRVKMRNHYLRSKLNLKIEEINSSIEKSNKEFSTKLLQSIIDEID